MIWQKTTRSTDWRSADTAGAVQTQGKGPECRHLQMSLFFCQRIPALENCAAGIKLQITLFGRSDYLNVADCTKPSVESNLNIKLIDFSLTYLYFPLGSKSTEVNWWGFLSQSILDSPYSILSSTSGPLKDSLFPRQCHIRPGDF